MNRTRRTPMDPMQVSTMFLTPIKNRMGISSESYEHLMDLRKQKKKHIHEALDELAVDNAEREEAKKHLLIITITNTK